MRMAGAAVQNLFADMGSPDFSKLGNMGQQAIADQKNMAMKSDFAVDKAGEDAEAMIKMAEANAMVSKAQGQAAQQSAIGSGLSSLGGMFGSVVGGLGGGAGAAAPSTTSFGLGSNSPAVNEWASGLGDIKPKFSFGGSNMFGGSR